jgi:hypothetical protein
MTKIKHDAVRLIKAEVARRIGAAELAAGAVWAAQETAEDARASYDMAPSGVVKSAVIETAFRVDRALQDWLTAQERVKSALAAEEVVLEALVALKAGKQ